ncbi:MAG: ornithine carbamoyltransferase [Candidatus Aenigmatarchaeota archaeon]|nr:MAG: ornithine carbamoyltransferase [Candidatus Aenigmarchaeota archaeon]
MTRHLLKDSDLTAEEKREILQLALKMKKNPDKYREALKGKTLIMYFEKTSTRTRLSFEAGMTRLGGHGIFLDKRTSQVGISELKDEIRAIERYADIMMARTRKHATLKEMAENMKIPLINGCCERYHPCQGLGDALTMIEHGGDLKGKKIVWLGIANNVSNSLVQTCTQLGAKVTLCIPEKDPGAVDKDMEDEARKNGLYAETQDMSCLKDADFVHTDTWVNMEFINDPKFADEKERRIKAFMPYQLNKALLDKHGSKAKIMHCMPCHVGYEISRDAIDHPNSLIFDQAENRMHIQNAIMVWLLQNS